MPVLVREVSYFQLQTTHGQLFEGCLSDFDSRYIQILKVQTVHTFDAWGRIKIRQNNHHLMHALITNQL